MQKKCDSITKEQIIKTTLMQIDHNGGASQVNLREVARIVGCSAPNIYNYFDSLDDLLNAALIRICEDYKHIIQNKISSSGNSEELLLSVFKAYVEYAIEFPGRLNFYHFEKLSIRISSEAEESTESVGNFMADLLNLGSEQEMPIDKSVEICNLLHRYLIGELSEYITGRRKIENKEGYIKGLVEYCKRVFDIFIG